MKYDSERVKLRVRGTKPTSQPTKYRSCASLSAVRCISHRIYFTLLCLSFRFELYFWKHWCNYWCGWAFTSISSWRCLPANHRLIYIYASLVLPYNYYCSDAIAVAISNTTATLTAESECIRNWVCYIHILVVWASWICRFFSSFVYFDFVLFEFLQKCKTNPIRKSNSIALWKVHALRLSQIDGFPLNLPLEKIENQK